MAMIKCSECGRDISDTASRCVGCGAPIGAPLNCAKFKGALKSGIDIKYAEIMRGKTNAEPYLTYVDGQILTAYVRNVCSPLGITPPQIEAACNLSDAILAPSSSERQRLIKVAIGAGGGVAGIGMIIAGVGAALGWGAGFIATVTAVFVSVNMAGPVAWVASGLTLAAMAGYFATTSNKHTDTERFLKVLKSSVDSAVDAIWPEQGEILAKAMVKRDSAA